MNKQNVFFALFIVIILIIISQNALGIGISRLTDIPPYIIAEPGKSYSFAFVEKGYGSDTFAYYDADEDLQSYVTLSEEVRIKGTYDKDFTATITFPAKIEAKPGMREIFVGAEEIIGDGGGISTKTKAQYRINIYVLYPEKYIEASFKTQNVNVNEVADFNVNVKNFGIPDIKVLMATVDIYNSNNEKVTTLTSDAYLLASGKEQDILLNLNTSGMKAGEYNATATIYYDGDEMIFSEKFTIGQMKIDVINHTQNLFADQINKFDVEIENEWKGKINDVYADITITTQLGDVNAKTTSESIESLSKTNLSGHIDLKDIEPGVYPVEIKVYYEKDKSVYRGNVNVIKPKLLERPGDLSLLIGLAVVVILVILTIINMVLLLKRNKKDQK